MKLALYQPDIPQNAGAILRLAACMGVPLDVIEPCGFVWSDSRMRRSGLDYMDRAALTRHESWAKFRAGVNDRLVLFSTSGSVDLAAFAFRRNDILLFGRESAGVPDDVHRSVEARVRIPMTAGTRALNVALAASMALGVALRQCDGFPARGTVAA